MEFCKQLTCEKRVELRRDIRKIERPGQVPRIINRVQTVINDLTLQSQIVRALRGSLFMEASDMVTEYMKDACPSPKLAIHISR